MVAGRIAGAAEQAEHHSAARTIRHTLEAYRDGIGTVFSRLGPPGHVPQEARILARADCTRVFASSHFRRSVLSVARSQRCPAARSSEASARHAFVQSVRLASRSE